MRNALSICLFFCSAVSYAQFSQFKGIWLSQALDCMGIIDSSNGNDIPNSIGTAKSRLKLDVYIHGDTISFKEKYRPEERMDLLVILKNDTSCTIKPINIYARNFFQNRPTIRFVKQEFDVDNTIVFEKIVYTSSWCGGDCPDIYMEIDNKKNVYIKGLFFEYEKIEIDTLHPYYTKVHPDLLLDTVRSGNFLGVLDDSLYKEFIHLVKTCHLKTIQVPVSQVADYPMERVTITYNGHEKYFASGNYPLALHGLFRYLYTLHKRVRLPRTEERP